MNLSRELEEMKFRHSRSAAVGSKNFPKCRRMITSR